jgi:iron complex outermembrane receptor protein
MKPSPIAWWSPLALLIAGTAHAQEAPATGDSEVIIVEGQAPSATATRIAVPLRETPATVNVVTSASLAERGHGDFVSALADVPGVNPALHYGGFDHLTIRGFGGEDFLIVHDGVRDERHPMVGGEAPIGSLVGVDRIEILKGPASALYGMSALGGVIHILHAQPTTTPTYEVSTALGSFGEARAALGMGGPVTTRLGDRLLYRLDLATQRGSNARDLEQEHTGATLAVHWTPSARHRLRVRGTWNDSTYGTDAGVPTVGGELPTAADPDQRYNSPYDHLRYQALRLAADYEVRISDAVTVRDRASIGREREDYLSIESISATDDGMVARSFFGFDHHFSPMIANQLEVAVRGHLVVDHELTVAYDVSVLRAVTPSGFADAPPVALVDPVETLGAPAVPWTRERTRNQQIHGAMLVDQISILPQLKVAIAGRVEGHRVSRRTDTLDPATGAVTVRGERVEDTTVAPSLRAGVVYLPTPWLSSYASLSTSVRPLLAPAGQDIDLDPERGRQVELGARVELGSRLTAQASLFQIDKANIVVDRPAMMVEQAGRARSRGGELSAVYQERGLRVAAAYGLTHATFREYASDGVDHAGKRLPEVPLHNASLWATYRARLGLGAGLGGRFLGRAFADRGNDVELPAYAIADAALFYENRRGSLWLNVENLAGDNVLDDRGLYYVSTLYDTQVTPGPGRTVLAQVRLTF